MASQYPKNQADALVQKGHEHMSAGHYDEALSSFLEAADLYAKDLNHKAQALQLQAVSEIYRLTGRTEKAIDTYKTLLALFEQLNDNAALIRMWNNMGLLQTMQDRFQDALNCFQEALKFSELLGNKYSMAQQFGNMGSANRDQEEYPAALKYYEKALQIYEELGNIDGRADQYTNIAYIHVMENRHKEALILYQKAFLLYEELKNEEKARFTDQNIKKLKELLGMTKQ